MCAVRRSRCGVLAFKPNTDDVRFAPSISLVKSLVDEGAHVRAYDPEAMEKAKSVLPNITYCSNPYEAAEGADAIVIVTEWDEFRQIDWDRLRLAVERPLVVDGRNMLDATEVAQSRISLRQRRPVFDDSGATCFCSKRCPVPFKRAR